MKIIQLTRPALDPRRDLELRMKEAHAGLSDFVQTVAPPSGWIDVELLDEPAAQPKTLQSREIRRA